MDKGCAGILTTNSHWLVPFLQFSCSSSFKHSCLPDPDSVLQNDQCSHVLLSICPTHILFSQYLCALLTDILAAIDFCGSIFRRLSDDDAVSRREQISHRPFNLSPGSDLYGILRDKKNVGFFLRLETYYTSCFVHYHSSLLVASVVYGIITDRVLKEKRLGHTHTVRNKTLFVTDPPFSRTCSSCVLPQVAVVGCSTWRIRM